MSRFITNINTYLSAKKIKQTYVSMCSGIDVKKLSRILTGSQDITSSDMEKIAAALGQDVQYFLQENFTISAYPDVPYYPFHPYQSTISQQLEDYTLQMVDFLQNADEILSAKKFFFPDIEQECAL